MAQQSEAMEGTPSVRQELWVLLNLAGPTIVQTASQQAMVFTDQVFVGHLGTNEMAAAALGCT
ncbi:multidrug and toxic compound extrusion protein, partial [Haematococcus lacustris]